jgi:hypothetical protein
MDWEFMESAMLGHCPEDEAAAAFGSSRKMAAFANAGRPSPVTAHPVTTGVVALAP